MRPKSRETQLRTKDSLTARLKQVKADLVEQGFDSQAVYSHVKVRQVRADLRRTNLRLGAIDALTKLAEELRAHKLQKAEAAEAAKTEKPAATGKSSKATAGGKQEKKVRVAAPDDDDDEPATKKKTAKTKPSKSDDQTGDKKSRGKKSDAE